MQHLASAGIVKDVIATLTEWVGGFITMVSTSFTEVIKLFYNSTDGLTTLGMLGLMGIGVGLVYLAINFVRSAFHF